MMDKAAKSENRCRSRDGAALTDIYIWRSMYFLRTKMYFPNIQFSNQKMCLIANLFT